LRSRRWGNGRVRPVLDSGTLEDLIQFATIKPYPPALEAVVNFNSMPLGHDQNHAAYWAQHSFAFPVV
jgi:hypothetical protein